MRTISSTSAGYSFQVAKLLRKIEVEFGTRLSMAALFEAPTVAHLAEVLGSSTKIARMTRIINLQASGTLEPLFWIYGGPLFRPLAQSLGSERPFLGVGIETSASEDLSQLTFLEHASRLVEIIRARQPQGPYYLGGWCSSGLLAYEIASQLLDAGQKVGLVVMLDAPNPAHYFKISKFHLLTSKAVYHARRLMRANLGAMLPYAWDRARGFVKHLFERHSQVDKAFQVSPDIVIIARVRIRSQSQRVCWSINRPTTRKSGTCEKAGRPCSARKLSKSGEVAGTKSDDARGARTVAPCRKASRNLRRNPG